LSIHLVRLCGVFYFVRLYCVFFTPLSSEWLLVRFCCVFFTPLLSKWLPLLLNAIACPLKVQPNTYTASWDIDILLLVCNSRASARAAVRFGVCGIQVSTPFPIFEFFSET